MHDGFNLIHYLVFSGYFSFKQQVVTMILFFTCRRFDGSRRIKSLLFIFLLSLLSLSSAVRADCYTNSATAAPRTVNIAPGQIIVQRDTPVGSLIYSTTTATTSDALICDPGGGYYAEMKMFTVPTGISHMYTTNIPGVGVTFGNATFNFESPSQYITNPYSNAGQAVFFYSRTLAFYKTGDIVSGPFTNGLFATIYGRGDRVVAVKYNLNGASILQVACSITTPNLVFPIGDILASTFGSSVGTTPAGAQNTQNLGLNCDPQANINVSLSGTQNPDVSTTSVLALTGQGNSDVAQGVGVQIVYNGSPLALNSRIVLKRSSGGQETFPLTARYYQTKGSVTTGTANASATLNLTYQ